MILFNSWLTPINAHIYAVVNDGSSLRCLTDTYALQRCQRLRISPDHKRLLFRAVPEGEETGHFYFLEIETGRLSEYKHEPAPYDLRWLTDDRLLCIRKDQLWITNLAAGSRSGLNFAGRFLVLDVSPDGDRLLLMDRAGRGSIYVGVIGAQQVQEIVRGEEYEKTHTICYGSSWSPDGQHIACVGGMEDEIWLVNPDGSKPRKFADTDYFWRRIVWSPDGKMIAYTRSLDASGPQSEIGGVFFKEIDSTQETQILTLRWSETWQWSADGQAMVFARFKDENLSLQSINIHTRVVTEVINSGAGLKNISEILVV